MFYFLFLVFFLLSAPLSAMAQNCYEYYFLSLKFESESGCLRNSQTGVGSGIASPSLTTTFGGNPARYALYRGLQMRGSYSGGKYSDASYSRSSFLGTGGMKLGGIGVNLEQLSQGEIIDYRYLATALGVGLNIPILGASLGFSYRNTSNYSNHFTTIGVETTSPSSLNGYDFGSIFHLSDRLKLGVALFDFLDSDGEDRELLVGLSGTNGRWSFGVDAGMTWTNEGAVLKPAVAWSGRNLQFNLAYGIAVKETVTLEHMPKGLLAGLGWEMASWLSWVAQYQTNGFHTFYLGFSLNLL